MRLHLKSLLILVLSIALGGTALAADAPGSAEPLLAGLAWTDVTPVIGVPLAGFGGGHRRIIPFDWNNRYRYSTFLKPSLGVHDPIRAKALVLERGGKKLLFLSLDVVGVTAAFRDDLLKTFEGLGFKKDEVFISATHTHSGPGTLSKEWVWELLAADKFQRKIYDRFVQGVLDAVQRADTHLEPAALFAMQFEAKGIQRNRRHVQGHFDPRANALLVLGQDGEWLGGMINLAVHGTALGTDNHLFSADVPGGLERALERRLAAMNDAGTQAPTVLFVNGAEGDVSPARGGFEGIDELGELFADEAVSAMPSLRRVEPDWQVTMGQVKVGRPAFHLLACASGKLRKFINKALKFPLLGHALPKVAPLWLLRIGDIEMLSWPGEPTTTIGLELKEMARQSGAEQAWVMGLTNGYMAYFTTDDEFRKGGYESCSSLYGSEGGKRIVTEYRQMLGLDR